MPPTTRQRSRSSVDHIFELVENLEEDQLQNLLDELNSSMEGNVQVSQGVEYFEEQRRARAAGKPGAKAVLRPTPSFLNQPHEPVDWPRQKPRPVSGSQWRQSMRIVSTPYTAGAGGGPGGGGLARHQTEPISPPLTASPPSSPPPLSPPRSAVSGLYGGGGSGSPRRSVTAPLLTKRGNGEEALRVDVQAVSSPENSPVTPPRDVGSDEDEVLRPSLTEFGSFSFGLDGAAESKMNAHNSSHSNKQEEDEDEDEERPVSPRQSAQVAPRPSPPLLAQPAFSRINTMPLSTLHHESFDTFHELPRPRTATGDAASTAFIKPRSFRRISRPMFLSPVNVSAPDDLAKKLSAYLFEGLSSPPSPPRAPTTSVPKPEDKTPSSVESSMEEMLREPLTPRSRFVFGRLEREVPNAPGIFEVLTEG